MPLTAELLQSALSKLNEPTTACPRQKSARHVKHVKAAQGQTRPAHLRSRKHTLELQSAARAYQARANAWCMSAPGPVLGEPIDAYRRRLMIQTKSQLPEGHDIREMSRRNIGALPNDAPAIFENQLYADVKAAAQRPDSAPSGELRTLVEQDANGLKQRPTGKRLPSDIKFDSWRPFGLRWREAPP
jgi:hypothetical protein